MTKHSFVQKIWVLSFNLLNEPIIIAALKLSKLIMYHYAKNVNVKKVLKKLFSISTLINTIKINVKSLRKTKELILS